MTFVDRLPIRIKLAFLAGIPVIGALLLAGLILQDARHRSASADALGSVEELAHLSAQMGSVMLAVQTESARVALDEGRRARSGATRDSSVEELAAAYASTDKATAALDALLQAHDPSKMPPRLARDLVSARVGLRAVRELRQTLAAPRSEEGGRPPATIERIIATYHDVDQSLINATAALTYLADDAELLRSISALVALSELAERCSLEHALLNDVFAENQFPPGTFKNEITLVSEQAIYAQLFRANASDEDVAAYDDARASATTQRALALRDRALATTDDAIGIDVDAWAAAEQGRLANLQAIEGTIVERISAAAARKMQATRFSVRLSAGLSGFVLLASGLLAWLIARGITRTILALSSAAAWVRTTRDFGVRAKKTSSDELGTLTDAFNEMLTDVQARDSELESHRTNLKQMVEARTAELAARNEAMRLVLDNVEQGLAMLRADGTFVSERSAAFDAITGTPQEGTSFADHLASHDPATRDMMKLAWELATDDFLPLEVALGQLPTRVERGGAHWTLEYKPIVRDGRFQGVLLVVSDVTSAVKGQLEQEAQREYIAIFERVVQDRDGFVAFAAEIEARLDRLASTVDVTQAMRLVHTIKGNTAQWGATAIARMAHELETRIVEEARVPTPAEKRPLVEAWSALSKRLRHLVASTATDRIEVTRRDIDDVLGRIRGGAEQSDVTGALVRMKHEPVALRFARLEDQIERLATRLDKPKPHVVIEDSGVRLPGAKFAGFWASTIHVIRNMMDHGIETPEDRAAAGKPAVGTILLSATESESVFTLTLSDNGRGIDWAAIEKRAAEAGLATATHADLERAVFHGGISTARALSDVSGRGVGMSAVLEECRALGGTLSLRSRLGEGVSLAFHFPRGAIRDSLSPVAPAPDHAA